MAEFVGKECAFMFFVAARAEQENTSIDVEVNSSGMIFFTPEEKEAARAMRRAEIAYHKQLGIYRPTLRERVKDFLDIA